MRSGGKNIAETDRPQMTVWCMRIAWWITTATNTLRICKTFCFSTVTMVKRMRLKVTSQVHCVSCWMTAH